jgi:hypothetical protein
LALGIVFLLSTWWSDYKNPITLLPQLDETAPMLRAFFIRLAWLILFLYFITTPKRIELAAWLIIGLITAGATGAFLGFLESGAIRAAASFSVADNENRLAYLCVLAFSLLWFYRAYGPSQMLKSLTLPLFFVLPIVALATGSRSGFLELLILPALLLYEGLGGSITKRARILFFVASLAILLALVVPVAQLTRVTTYDPSTAAPGSGSLRDRIDTISAALELSASDPVLGIGIGNFVWMHRAFYGTARSEHNSYLWALTSGGIPALGLYLLLFYVTYRMLRQLERAGPKELLWVSKGLRVGLVLFLVFSPFASFWLNKVTYFIIQLTAAMYCYWQRSIQPRSNQFRTAHDVLGNARSIVRPH